jgi:MSHA biogenesis protein MshI
LVLFKRRIRTDGLTGVSLQPDGVALARVVRGKSLRPTLECMRFSPAPSGTERAAKVRDAVQSLGVDRTYCNNVIEPADYQLLLVEAPDVRPEELKAAVRWRVKDLIGFHIDDAVIDVFEIPDQGRPGQARMMYVVAARAGVVGQYVDSLDNSGMQLQSIDIPELCLRNITALTDDDVQGAALLYFTASYGLMVLTRQHTLYLARKLDVGADTLASAHRAGRERQYLESIVLEVQRSLDYYDSHFSQPPIASLLIAPSEIPLPFLQPYLSENLGVPVRNLDLGALLDSREKIDEDTQARCMMAVGASLRMESVAL